MPSAHKNYSSSPATHSKANETHRTINTGLPDYKCSEWDSFIPAKTHKLFIDIYERGNTKVGERFVQVCDITYEQDT